MFETLMDLRVQLQTAMIVILFLAALRWGAVPEKLVAGLLAAMIVFHVGYHSLVGGAIVLAGVDLGHVAIDLALLVALGAVALHANRVYPLWLTAAQLISVFSYAYRYLDGEGQLGRGPYDVMATLPFYLCVLFAWVGFVRHVLRRRHHGDYPSWSAATAGRHRDGSVRN
ncbi:hypothetical protein [Novosphingobium mangrovi (ex Hu et al. 2023)]|uniref:Uncharacterized protein n=1 Tax=Novosphingobium mangrovi (ex Hu et al. 2023) TaxID=2930094 RepID=A0ABT0A7D8_9SPHN|nr:hypothetical protein [Novosphingobium mangrovi (ex Hu et al. 2023)]MCJ1959108.1 hypothetical protein [Novosphingobium mangrovi (ex Hu et al. 2023)]